MATYLSLRLGFALDGASWSAAMQWADDIAPVAAGATGRRGGKPELFVAGYAIEDFLCRVSRGTAPDRGPAHVAPHPDDALGYLRNRLNELGPGYDRSARSPFEVEEVGHDLTRMTADTSLSEAAARELATWANDRSDVTAYVIHAVDVVARDGTWKRSLRWIDRGAGPTQPAGIPLLMTRSERSRFEPDRFEVTVHSAVPIWLVGSSAFRGRISPAAADANLARLAAFCGRVARSGAPLCNAELDLEGNDFRAEATRLRTALGDAIGRPLPASPTG